MSIIPNNNNDSRSTHWDRMNAISNATMAVSAVLMLFVTFFATSNNLPLWFLYVPLAMFITAFVFILRNASKKFIAARARRKIAISEFPTLTSLCKEFSNLTSLRLNDTIVYAFGKVPQTDGQLQKREYAALSEWVTNNLISRLETCERSFSELRIGVQDLYALTLSFYRTYFIDGIKNARTLDTSKIGEEEKRIIEVSRESFVAYLGRFQSFTNGIDESLGKREFNFYFEKAAPL